MLQYLHRIQWSCSLENLFCDFVELSALLSYQFKSNSKMADYVEKVTVAVETDSLLNPLFKQFSH